MPKRSERILKSVGRCLEPLFSAHNFRQQRFVGLQVAGDAAHNKGPGNPLLEWAKSQVQSGVWPKG